MTKFEDLKNALNAGAKIVVGLHTFKGAADVAKFTKVFGNDANYLKYSQTRVFFPGVKYRTSLLAG